MKTLKESIEYAKNKKEHQLSKLKGSHYLKAIEKLKIFLNTGKGLGSNIDRLSTWYLWSFIHKFITENKVEYNLLAKSTYYALESNNQDYFFCKRIESCDLATPFTESIKHLAQMLYLGWEDRAIQYGNLLIKMLYGKQYKGGHSAYKHPWFMIDLFCKWQQIELDRSKLRNPDNLEVYEKVLSIWNTTDTTLLSKTVDELTEFHIQESDEYVKTDEYGNEAGSDFPSANYFIFPIEILMWLSIRRALGLPEYKPSSQNKLMQLEINQLPKEIFSFPKDELVEKCKEKLLKDNPDITFEL